MSFRRFARRRLRRFRSRLRDIPCRLFDFHEWRMVDVEDGLRVFCASCGRELTRR